MSGIRYRGRSHLAMYAPKSRPFVEQTPEGAQRPAAVGPWQDGVAGPEAAPARSGSEAPDRLWGGVGEEIDPGDSGT